MTISNETKVGSLTAIAIVLLLLGFNFLKGKSIGGKKTEYSAIFLDIQGLANSNAVTINGKEVGNIINTDGGEDMRKIKVTIGMKEKVNIPDDSYAIISKSLLGTVQLEIKLGNSKTILKDGGIIKTLDSGDIIGDALKKLDPVLYEVTKAVHSLDSLMGSVNSIFDPASKNNIKVMLENLNKTTGSLVGSSASLQTLLNTETGSLAKTLDNVNSFTGGLKNNNEKISQTLTNLQTTTDHFSKLDLEKTLNTINGTVSDLKTTIEKLNTDKGTAGLLLNDTKLYNNLTATSNKINLLLDDIRVNPKRYVNVSVFGRKNKSTPLMTPLPDTVNAPYLNK